MPFRAPLVLRPLRSVLIPALTVLGLASCGAAGGKSPARPALTSAETAVDGESRASDPAKPDPDAKRLWEVVTLDFEGPQAAEDGAINPFTDYRLDVEFKHGDRTVWVPGYFAADGNAAETSAQAGNRWRVHFVPDETGEWTYRVHFREGPNVALGDDRNAGEKRLPDGLTGRFGVIEAGEEATGFHSKGMLRYVGKRYLQFAGSGEYFLKAGANSPESLLAFADFDQTPPTHRYAPHLADWQPGDPVWKDEKGKGLIGALNYLASQGMNAVYFLTMSVGGDGNDVWPWTAPGERYRFDVSKLAQWEVAFGHMDRLGLLMHVVTQETENDQLLDGGELGPARKLYYRELVARFGHHLGLVWNLGEENTNSDAQRKVFAGYLRDLDPYDHPIAVHTYPREQELVFGPLAATAEAYPFEGAALQLDPISSTHEQTLTWLRRSAAGGRPWMVTLDEIGPSYDGVVPDAVDPEHNHVREQALWGNLMAGGAGVEWYFGYQHANDDLDAEDWRSRQNMWRQSAIALALFQKHLPFAAMESADPLTAMANDFVLAKPGEAYAIYLPMWTAGTTTLDLRGETGTYTVAWYNPREGGALLTGSVAKVQGGTQAAIGYPPSDSNKDWVAVIKKL